MSNTQFEIWQLVDASGLGGIESHILTLSKALRAAGQEVRIQPIRQRPDMSFAATAAHQGLAVNAPLRSWAELVAKLKSQRILLHTHGYRAGIEGRTAALLTGTPCVSTYHAGDPGEGRVRLYTMIDEATSRLGEAISVSEAIGQRLAGPSTQIDNFVHLPPQAAGTARHTIGYVGRLSKEKGADRLPELAQMCPEQPFLVCGHGPLWSDLRQNRPDNLFLLGPQDMTAETWSRIGLLCMPSRQEGLPMAALEAMSHGIPVASFAVGGLPTLINQGQNGWTAPAGDTFTLASILKHWRDMPQVERQRMCHTARSYVADNYTPHSQLPKVLKVYAKALARRQPRSFTTSTMVMR
jgi:glycosyltransferase involved in cell wall biosynthesis